MATFNVDSLDFVDDEEVRTGDSDEFATRYDSGNDRLEIEDLLNATAAHIPRDVGTDLVGGKYAETVSEGKALADDGEVYESIQTAVHNASSWVKVGPGEFRESVIIGTAGLTLRGSGDRTVIVGQITVNADDVSFASFQTNSEFNTTHIDATGQTNTSIEKVSVESISTEVTTPSGNPTAHAVSVGSNSSVTNCTFRNLSRGLGYVADSVFTENVFESIDDFCMSRNPSLDASANNVISNNTFRDSYDGINFGDADSVVVANVFIDMERNAVREFGVDCIIAKNRIKNVGNAFLGNASGTLFADNLITG